MRRGTESIGAVAAPEVDAALEPYDGAALVPRFSIEAVELVDAGPFAGADAGAGEFVNVRMTRMSLAETRLRGVRLSDVVADDVEATGADWTGAALSRVVFDRCRLTGLQLPEADLRDVTFRGCKIDYANFRMARLERVTFEDCLLHDTDFSNGVLERVALPSCVIRETDFHNARLSQVDLREADFALRGSPAALRGAIVSPVQLVELAPAMAAELGVEVDGGE